MKKYHLIAVAMVMAIFILSACSKDDEDNTAPVLENLEIGLGNSLQFHRGGDVHLEFEAFDNEGLSHYSVEIHQEMKSSAEAWEYQNTWDFTAGAKNELVHQHEIPVPGSADLGMYHFHLAVFDINGNATHVEEDVEVLEEATGDGPEIHVESHPADGEIFTNGQSISVSGHVHSETSHIAGLFIGIVQEADGLADDEVNAGNSIVLYHAHDFEIYEVNFDASLVVGAAEDNNDPAHAIESWNLGEAYILLKTKDENDRWSFSQHYHIEVNEQ